MKKDIKEIKKKNNKGSSKKENINKNVNKIKDKKVVSKSEKSATKNKKEFFSKVKNYINSKKKQNKKTNRKDSNKNSKGLNKVKDKKRTVNNKNLGNKVSFFEKRFSFDIFDLLMIVIVTAIVACLGTGFILNVQYRKNFSYIDADVVENEKVQEFLETYGEIVTNFYEEVDEDAMIEAALDGMLDFLEDKYSIFLDSNDTEELSEMLDSAYEGIGIVAMGNVVYSVYEDSPAAKAGIQPNDEIIEINGTAINIENYTLISELIDKETVNTIIVNRDGANITFNLEVSKVSVPTVSSNVIVSENKDKKIGYLALTTFSSHSFEEFQEELMELENDKEISSLIIDLRDNSGGYLNSVTNISSLFLEKGKVIYSLKNKEGVTEYKDDTRDSREYDIVVLVNNNTASAAEILAAALHDSYGATIVGKTTYGKGKVQTMKYYEDTMIKYTSAEWLRPNGECIDKVGIEPDYIVDLQYGKNVIYDLQLDKAIELLS